jgi:stage II sporulation protein AB (anti-sigma F factor)
MSVKDEIKLQFPALSENEAFARTAVSAFITKLDPRVDELADIRTAVSEAVTNAVVHAYREEPGQVYMTVRILKDRVVSIHIKDKGCGIEDIEKARTPLFTTAQNEERSGLGFAVMESFMDTLSVRSTAGAGTSICMKKKLAVKT